MELLTLEQVIAAKGTPVYMEFKRKAPTQQHGWVLVCGERQGRVGLTDSFTHSHWFWPNRYNVGWRCWSGKPTQEEMEAMPWQE